MKINLILLFIFLLFTLCKCQNINGTYELIKDTYSYNGGCSAIFNVIVSIETSLDTLTEISLEDTVSRQVISSTDPNDWGYKSKQSNSTHTFYSFMVKCPDLKSTSDYTDPLGFHVYGVQFNFPVYLKDGAQFQYTCNSPPQLNINSNILLSTPINIETSFLVKVDNLENSLASLDITPQDSNYPFTLKYVKSEKHYIQFNLVFDKTSSTSSFTAMIFQCSYGTEGSFNLVLNSPVSEIASNLVTVDAQYPSGSSYITSNNWDTNNLVFINVTGIDQNVFFYSILSGYASPSLDKNQRVRLVTGSYSSGQVLVSSSYYPDRSSNSQSSITTYLYKDSTSLTTITKVNNNIDVSLSQLTNPTISNDLKVDYSLSEFNFNLDKYPYGYSFAIKYGESNSYIPTYPFGIQSSTSTQTQYKFPYSMKTSTIGIGFDVTTDLMDKQTFAKVQQDINAPTILEFTVYYPRGGNGLYAFIKITVSDDISGFEYLYYAGNYITSEDITTGNINYGTFEKMVLVNFDTTCYYADKAGNKASCQNQDDPYAPYYYSLYPQLQVPRLVDYNIEFTDFRFESDVYDVSEEARLVTVLLNYTAAQEDIPIQFYILDRVYGDKYIDYNSTSSRYLMDKSIHQFKITVLIPAKLCSGTVPYLFIINGKRFENDYFYTSFGNKANLNVVSNDCYELPPIITSIDYSLGTLASNAIGINDVAALGWKVRIETKSYLKHAFISAVGDSDRQPYVLLDIQYDYDDRIDNVLLDAVWVFRGDRKSQTISIYNVTLLDHRGFKSELIYDQDIEYIYENKIPNTPLPISPLFKVLDQSLFSFFINTGLTTTDTTPPQLLSIVSTKQSVEIGLPGGNSDTIGFLFSTTDDVAISNEVRHYPKVYLESFRNFGSHLNSILECSTSFIDITNTAVHNYRADCSIPYGFGLDGLSVNVFGIVDTSFNVYGYTASDIKSSLAGSSFFILTAFTKLPIIQSFISPSGNSDKLTILGRNLAIDQSSTKALVSFDGYSFESAPISQYSNVGLIVSVSSYSKSFVVKVSTDGIESNSYQVPPLADSSSSSSQLPNYECLDNCGGSSHGQCIQNVGCRCVPPYSGPNCLFESIKVPKPTINKTSPNSLNVFTVGSDDSSNIQLNTIVSIVAIRELDVYDKQISIHNFTEWNYKELSSTSYSYTSGINKNGDLNVSNIQVVLEWFEESKLISFANQNFTINPSSFKYYVNIDSYPFDTQLNSLELVIKTSFQSNQTNACSSKEFGLNDGQDYMTLMIGKYSFEAKFIKAGIFDGKNKVLSHRVLSNFTGTDSQATSNQQYSYVAIQLGHYESSVVLDPNFSVLLNPSETGESNESICSNSNSNSKSSKLTSAQIAGIVVGSVALITILSLVVLFKLSKSIKCLRLKVILYRIFKR